MYIPTTISENTAQVWENKRAEVQRNTTIKILLK